VVEEDECVGWEMEEVAMGEGARGTVRLRAP
jgi:hypothetical protein